ncbi:hypothetical protein [Acidimangrovimonas pyrenivorans]|uniref:Uncharacterized protein n=1 Tax=Acidimangrovimonas pyrenivorans TaxID=2030798 RepID=A0ABV7AJ94_9RHOB
MDLTEIINRLRELPGPWTRHFDESRRRHVLRESGEPLPDRHYRRVMQALGAVDPDPLDRLPELAR